MKRRYDQSFREEPADGGIRCCQGDNEDDVVDDDDDESIHNNGHQEPRDAASYSHFLSDPGMTQDNGDGHHQSPRLSPAESCCRPVNSVHVTSMNPGDVEQQSVMHLSSSSERLYFQGTNDLDEKEEKDAEDTVCCSAKPSHGGSPQTPIFRFGTNVAATTPPPYMEPTEYDAWNESPVAMTNEDCPSPFSNVGSLVVVTAAEDRPTTTAYPFPLLEHRAAFESEVNHLVSLFTPMGKYDDGDHANDDDDIIGDGTFVGNRPTELPPTVSYDQDDEHQYAKHNDDETTADDVDPRVRKTSSNIISHIHHHHHSPMPLTKMIPRTSSSILSIPGLSAPPTTSWLMDDPLITTHQSLMQQQARHASSNIMVLPCFVPSTSNCSFLSLSSSQSSSSSQPLAAAAAASPTTPKSRSFCESPTTATTTSFGDGATAVVEAASSQPSEREPLGALPRHDLISPSSLSTSMMVPFGDGATAVVVEAASSQQPSEREPLEALPRHELISPSSLSTSMVRSEDQSSKDEEQEYHAMRTVMARAKQQSQSLDVATSVGDPSATWNVADLERLEENSSSSSPRNETPLHPSDVGDSSVIMTLSSVKSAVIASDTLHDDDQAVPHRTCGSHRSSSNDNGRRRSHDEREAAFALAFLRHSLYSGDDIDRPRLPEATEPNASEDDDDDGKNKSSDSYPDLFYQIPMEDVITDLESAKTKRQRETARKFHIRFQELVKFRVAHGHCKVPQRSGALGIWVNKLRSGYQRYLNGTAKGNALNPIRVHHLDAIEFHWGYRKGDTSWNLKLERLREFHSKFGHCNVPTKYKDDPPLGRWVSTIRKEYGDLLEVGADAYTGPLKEDMIVELEQAGFQWEMIPRRSKTTTTPAQRQRRRRRRQRA